ncbi:hypothetical protein [Pseudosulfitobacter sp. SM2401]|jgi:hypothetical protein|uniref:hypothetical protein n=1 Tax=Pseudosulfitobacter sp. SM2401 TaxID=3350098 RepID=UPI002A26ACF4|nr:hypothetical protein [Ascidiaceihabitans sp.]
MFNRVKMFFKEDSGAITVDWVVLTAALVAMAAGIAATMQSSILVLTGYITALLSGWSF